MALTNTSPGSGILPFSLICVFAESGGDTRQFNCCCGESTTKQLSVVVRPVSMPPPNRTPDGRRASTEKVTKLETCVCLPKSEAGRIRLSALPNLSGLMSYRPQIW
jgi:hypothetical protein